MQEEMESDEKDCTECENWKRRGDELFDELDAIYKLCNEKCDEVRELLELNGELRLLLSKNGIDHEL
jgi:hypothetical protein